MKCIEKSNTIDIQKIKEKYYANDCCESRWEAKQEATDIFNEMDLDVSAAVKKFLIMFKLDHDFETELGNGDYIRTRDVSE